MASRHEKEVRMPAIGATWYESLAAVCTKKGAACRREVGEMPEKERICIRLRLPNWAYKSASADD
uniref:Uncharacterized protein n=1 Tax=Arundo donax TaxID=35708 RepID=A0A0A8XRB2_ARUDO